MKKILISLMVIVLSVGVIGGAAFAVFSDTETSTGNVMTAGTVDLELNTENPASSPLFTATNMGCGDSMNVEFNYKNIGSLAGNAAWVFSYVEDDCAVPGEADLGGLSADAVAKALYVTNGEWNDGTGWTDVQANWDSYCAGNDGIPGSMSVYDMAAAGIWDDTDTMDPNETHYVKFTITFDPDQAVADGVIGTGANVNWFQCDGIDATVTLTLTES